MSGLAWDAWVVGSALIVVLPVLLRQLGLARGLCCKMHWHSPARLWIHGEHDGASQHAECPWCGYRGMIDSQGNLF